MAHYKSIFYHLTMHGIAQYLPLTVRFYHTILNKKYMDCLRDWLQFELLNVMQLISWILFCNKNLSKNIFPIIYVLDEF